MSRFCGPPIDKHMKKMVRNKQIDEFKIETFDNRGPYVLVVLSEKNRGKAVKAVATQIAESLHTNLTKTNNLKVNQVVIKVVDPEQYAEEQAREGGGTGHGRAVLTPRASGATCGFGLDMSRCVAPVHCCDCPSGVADPPLGSRATERSGRSTHDPSSRRPARPRPFACGTGLELRPPALPVLPPRGRERRHLGRLQPGA